MNKFLTRNLALVYNFMEILEGYFFIFIVVYSVQTEKNENILTYKITVSVIFEFTFC